MPQQINCEFNNGAFCHCPKVKRDKWGFGARHCIEYYNSRSHSVICEFRKSYVKPPPPPPPPPRDICGQCMQPTDICRVSQTNRISLLEEALEFYADSRSYEQRQRGYELASAVELDNGLLARTLLNGDHK